MAVTALKIKIMPESPDSDLNEITKSLEKSLIEAGAIKINSIETC